MKIILIASLVIATAGIILLLVLSLTFVPKKIEINNINSDFLYKKVKVIGKIVKISSFKEFQIITLKDSTGSIQVLSNKIYPFQKEETLMVIGKVQEYKDSLQISCEKISLMTLKLN